VANPNSSLGRIWKNSQKYQLFGPYFDENRGKLLTFDPSLVRKKFFLGRGLATPAPKAPKALETNDFRLLQKVDKI
jgi:hypothetical protein